MAPGRDARLPPAPPTKQTCGGGKPLTDIAGAVAEEVDRHAVVGLIAQHPLVVSNLESGAQAHGDALADEGIAAKLQAGGDEGVGCCEGEGWQWGWPVDVLSAQVNAPGLICHSMSVGGLPTGNC